MNNNRMFVMEYAGNVFCRVVNPQNRAEIIEAFTQVTTIQPDNVIAKTRDNEAIGFFNGDENRSSAALVAQLFPLDGNMYFFNVEE